jgi:hypothetical protein
MESKDVWLDHIALTCSTTLSLLNKKAEEQGMVAEDDQLMSELCMGYLYLLSVCDSTGALDSYPEQYIGEVLNRTVH